MFLKGAVSMSRFLYADHAATTALSPRALEAMMPYFRDTYGNPSSLYAFGQHLQNTVYALQLLRELSAA